MRRVRPQAELLEETLRLRQEVAAAAAEAERRAAAVRTPTAPPTAHPSLRVVSLTHGALRCAVAPTLRCSRDGRGGCAQAAELDEELSTYREAFTCQICMHARANLALVSCGHRFCNQCMGRLQSNGLTRCAFCRQEYTGTIPVFL